MPLQVPTNEFSKAVKVLIKLVTDFNTIPETEHIARLFHLQKISYFLNTITLTPALYAWLNQSGEKGWLKQLEEYDINPDATFFLKGFQFAKAVTKRLADKATLDTSKNEYQLMQKRDVLLESNSFAQCGAEYVSICQQLSHLAETDLVLKDILAMHASILKLAKPKIDAMKGIKTANSDQLVPSYTTEDLGEQTNNHNFRLEIGEYDQPFVLSVQDRAELELEQRLHSFPVSKYFNPEYANFWGWFFVDNTVEYRPVVLSQYANKGSLADVARSLQVKKDNEIAFKCRTYFRDLSYFCIQLMAAKAYHPDIKLTNFLVHNDQIRLSDRKTLVQDEKPFASEIRSTPQYAPDEYNQCLSKNWRELNYAIASKTQMDMPKFMAYQFGMALKEFLILTQQEDQPEVVDFRNPDITAASYFTNPPIQIVNLSLLVQELTHSEASKRLHIEQFQYLLTYLNYPKEQFAQEIKNVPPMELLKDINTITMLLKGNSTGEKLIKQANVIFNKLSKISPKNPHFTKVIEPLAIKCYEEHSKPFLKTTVESALFNKDWESAPWYRKAIHWLTAGYFGIDRDTDISEVKDIIIADLKNEQFQSYLPHLDFLTQDQMATDEDRLFKDFITIHRQEIFPDSTSSDEPITVEMPQDSTPKDKPVTVDAPVVDDLFPATIPRVPSFPLATALPPKESQLPIGTDVTPTVPVVVQLEVPSVGTNTDPEVYPSVIRNIGPKTEEQKPSLNRFFRFSQPADAVRNPTAAAPTPGDAARRGDGKTINRIGIDARLRLSALQFKTPTKEEWAALREAAKLESQTPTHQATPTP